MKSSALSMPIDAKYIFIPTSSTEQRKCLRTSSLTFIKKTEVSSFNLDILLNPNKFFEENMKKMENKENSCT